MGVCGARQRVASHVFPCLTRIELVPERAPEHRDVVDPQDREQPVNPGIEAVSFPEAGFVDEELHQKTGEPEQYQASEDNPGQRGPLEKSGSETERQRSEHGEDQADEEAMDLENLSVQ